MKKALVLSAPIGLMTLVEENGALTEVRFGKRMEDCVPESSPVLELAARQLKEYFCGERREFSVPVRLQGTPFQLRCWQALLQIPYGETRTYGWQAAAAGSPGACRAVGMANHRNPLPVIVPCHRVVGADGKLTGYAGGVDIKQTLLQIERMNIK